MTSADCSAVSCSCLLLLSAAEQLLLLTRSCSSSSAAAAVSVTAASVSASLVSAAEEEGCSGSAAVGLTTIRATCWMSLFFSFVSHFVVCSCPQADLCYIIGLISRHIHYCKNMYYCRLVSASIFSHVSSEIYYIMMVNHIHVI